MITVNDLKNILVTIIVAVLSSGALFSFLQFMLTRRDTKKNFKGEIEKQISEGFKEVKADIKEVKDDVKGVKEDLEEHKATLARTHILRFADELRTGTHSKEYFELQLKDIDTYNDYCKNHPNFANGLTKMAGNFIQEEYRRLYLSHNDTA